MYTENEQKIVVNDMIFDGQHRQLSTLSRTTELANDSKETVSVMNILSTHKQWDTVTVLGNPEKPLQLVEATFTDATGSIPLDVFEETTPEIMLGKSYKLTNIQLKVCSGCKKISTTKQTTITEINDKSVTTITV